VSKKSEKLDDEEEIKTAVKIVQYEKDSPFDSFFKEPTLMNQPRSPKAARPFDFDFFPEDPKTTDHMKNDFFDSLPDIAAATVPDNDK
jgi:hypothetical protein